MRSTDASPLCLLFFFFGAFVATDRHVHGHYIWFVEQVKCAINFFFLNRKKCQQVCTAWARGQAALIFIPRGAASIIFYCLLELWTRNKSAKSFLASTQSRQSRPKAKKCSRGPAPDCSREEILASQHDAAVVGRDGSRVLFLARGPGTRRQTALLGNALLCCFDTVAPAWVWW